MTIHEAIKALRKHMGKSQQAFATELGMSISALSNYERNRTPDLKQLLMFKGAAYQALRFDLADVFDAAYNRIYGFKISYALLPAGGDWYGSAATEALYFCLLDVELDTNYRDYADIAPAVVSAISVVVARIAELKGNPAFAETFRQEAMRRGHIPVVDGRAVWPTEIHLPEQETKGETPPESGEQR
jgi:transcriptional regulator with XRE-family HTH domain